MKPSEDLERLIIEGYLDKEPFNKIKKLNNIEQNPKYHPEGSVLKHVLLVVDLASEYKKYSNDEKVFMWAALLHDIGKIGIPDRILNKPEKLTDEEYGIMKSHVTKGAEILKSFTIVDMWKKVPYIIMKDTMEKDMCTG